MNKKKERRQLLFEMEARRNANYVAALSGNLIKPQTTSEGVMYNTLENQAAKQTFSLEVLTSRLIQLTAEVFECQKILAGLSEELERVSRDTQRLEHRWKKQRTLGKSRSRKQKKNVSAQFDHCNRKIERVESALSALAGFTLGDPGLSAGNADEIRKAIRRARKLNTVFTGSCFLDDNGKR